MKRGGIRSPWPLLTAVVLGMSLARGAVPEICGDGAVPISQRQRAPPAVAAYFDSLGQERFDQRAACARWAGMSYRRSKDRENASAAYPLPARFIVFPAPGIELQRLANWAGNTRLVKSVEFARTFLVVVIRPADVRTPIARIPRFAPGVLRGARLRRSGLPDDVARAVHRAWRHTVLLATLGPQQLPK